MSRVSSVRKTAAAAVITGGVALTALGAAAAPALAKTARQKPRTTATSRVAPRAVPRTGSSSPESVTANFDALDFSVQFNAQLAAGAAEDQATGTFTAHMLVGSTSVASLAGPITCLDVSGPYIGLFYPVTSSSPSLLGEAFKGVYVSVELGSDGQPVSMIFRPSEASGVSSCAPSPGLIPIESGTVTESN